MSISKETANNVRTSGAKGKPDIACIGIRTHKASVKLQRFEGNPIISPNSANKWESFATTNPGAYFDEQTGTVNMLYRAAGNDSQHVIRFGLAVSKDGCNFKRFDEPAISPSIDGLDGGCIEDPRIVKMGKFYFITYATRAYPPGEYWLNNGNCYKNPDCSAEFPLCIRENHTTSHLLITKDFKNFTRGGRLTDPMMDDRDVILFPEKIGGKFYMLHRPMDWCGEKYGTDHPAMWISAAEDLLAFKQSKLLAKATFPWELKIGGNTPPIKTKAGWLTLYHAVGHDQYYRLGAMLLDLDDPTKVKYRTKDWIFQPETDYETKGHYFGGGVVFPCGKVIIGDKLFVYYGAADKYVGLATCKVDDLINYLLQCPVKD
jgi:beta-1,2-mannobiose phosphorylase / 1,2-beta-oligomannan phosphorylase